MSKMAAKVGIHIKMISTMFTISIFTRLRTCAFAREITFSPPFGVEISQQALADHDVDISTGSDFYGLTTFANLPYGKCFVDDWSPEGEDAYDIAILGAPFDTVSPM